MDVRSFLVIWRSCTWCWFCTNLFYFSFVSVSYIVHLIWFLHSRHLEYTLITNFVPGNACHTYEWWLYAICHISIIVALLNLWLSINWTHSYLSHAREIIGYPMIIYMHSSIPLDAIKIMWWFRKVDHSQFSEHVQFFSSCTPFFPKLNKFVLKQTHVSCIPWKILRISNIMTWTWVKICFYLSNLVPD